MDTLIALDCLADQWLHPIKGYPNPVLCWVYGEDGYVMYESGDIEELVCYD